MVPTPNFSPHSPRSSLQRTMVDMYWLGVGLQSCPNTLPTVLRVKYKAGVAERRCSLSIAIERRRGSSDRIAKRRFHHLYLS